MYTWLRMEVLLEKDIIFVFLKKREKKIVLHIHGAEYILFYNKLSGKKKEIVHE